jgi:protease-4
MLDLAASGGYYIAMAAEEIYAHPTTVTGSIGVIAMFPEIQELSKRVGVSGQVIKSGEMKDIGSFWRKMPQAEREVMQGLVDGMYERFVDVIAEGRPKLERERIRELGDGRVYTAEQAREAGLVDGIMYLDELVDYVREQIAEPKARVIMYRKVSDENIDSFYASAQATRGVSATAAGATTVNLLNVDLGALAAPKGPVFHYMWVP